MTSMRRDDVILTVVVTLIAVSLSLAARQLRVRMART